MSAYDSFRTARLHTHHWPAAVAPCSAVFDWQRKPMIRKSSPCHRSTTITHPNGLGQRCSAVIACDRSDTGRTVPFNRRKRRETVQRRRPWRLFRDRPWARLSNLTVCHRPPFPAPARGRRPDVHPPPGTRTRPGTSSSKGTPVRPVVHSIKANLLSGPARPP